MSPKTKGIASWALACLLLVILTGDARACLPDLDSELHAKLDVLAQVLRSDPYLTVSQSTAVSQLGSQPTATLRPRVKGVASLNAAPGIEAAPVIGSSTQPTILTVKCIAPGVTCSRAKLQALADLTQTYLASINAASNPGFGTVDAVFEWAGPGLTPRPAPLDPDSLLKLFQAALTGNHLFSQAFYYNPTEPVLDCDPDTGTLYVVIRPEVVQYMGCNGQVDFRNYKGLTTRSCNMIAQEAMYRVLGLGALNRVEVRTAAKEALLASTLLADVP